MARKSYRPEQIINKLPEEEILLKRRIPWVKLLRR